MSKNALCVFNARSGGAGAYRLDAVLSALTAAGAERCRALVPKNDIVRETIDVLVAEGPFDVAIGVGGDGTHNAVINALTGLKTICPDIAVPPYALVPMGTGNNVAKSIGLEPRTAMLPLAARTAIAGTPTLFDLGEVDGRCFADAFSVGFDARILACRDRAKQTLATRFPFLYRLVQGYPLYLYAAARTFAAFRRVKATISVDGETFYEGPLGGALINNTRVYGGVFEPTSPGRYDDGALDAALSPSTAAFCRYYLGTFRHGPAWLKAITRASAERRKLAALGREFKIVLDRPCPAQLDGESLPEKTVYVARCLPARIRVMLPSPPPHAP